VEGERVKFISEIESVLARVLHFPRPLLSKKYYIADFSRSFRGHLWPPVFHSHLIFPTAPIELCGREDGHLATLRGRLPPSQLTTQPPAGVTVVVTSTLAEAKFTANPGAQLQSKQD
jgi:hypothetical protein